MTLVAAFSAATVLVLLFSTPAKAQLPPFKIVHLGDSYSAGNGARDSAGNKDFYSVSGCYRSKSNWGSHFARSLGEVFSVSYINRACSDGVLADITRERELDEVLKGFSGCPLPDFHDEEIIRDTSLLSCTRSLRPQIEAVDSSVDLVIMTILGNDARFKVIIEQCFVLGLRDVEACQAAIDFANTFLDSALARQELVNTFAEVRSRLEPEARVVLVAYPHLLLNVPYVLIEDGLTYDAGTAIRALAEKGDMVQAAAVAAANTAAGEDYIVYFDSTKDLFDTHEPDPSTAATNADRWINEFFEGNVPEWYHFNPLGHQKLGEALSILGTFGSVGGSFEEGANIDLVFVVDTTGSMGDEIAEVRTNLADLVSQLAGATSTYRVAVVSYRDFPERAGASNYPSRVDQSFTSDLAAIQAGIDSLIADGGGDFPETVFSGIKAAIDLPWRPGVTKIAVVIGDAPALVEGDVEPISMLTSSQIVAESIAVDPVQVIAVDVGSLTSAALDQIVTGTGGMNLNGVGDLADTLSDIIDLGSKQPFAWFGFAVAGEVGAPVVFDAQGYFDPSGLPIDLYEWDFDGDGVFDFSTTEDTATYSYDAAFDGFVILRATSEGGSGLASARTTINEQGFVSQRDEDPCELDGNGVSIYLSDDGTFLKCFPDSLPTTDTDGLREFETLRTGCPESDRCCRVGMCEPARYSVHRFVNGECRNRCILQSGAEVLTQDHGFECGSC
jgi:lysophospholipase L1-like esterase